MAVPWEGKEKGIDVRASRASGIANRVSSRTESRAFSHDATSIVILRPAPLPHAGRRISPPRFGGRGTQRGLHAAGRDLLLGEKSSLSDAGGVGGCGGGPAGGAPQPLPLFRSLCKSWL